MTILRAPKPEKGFRLARNDVARDRRISLRAHGLLSWMLSWPDDWDFGGAARIAGQVKEGRVAILSALKELEAAGYLHRRKRRAKSGWEWDWIVSDVPRSDDLSRSRFVDAENSDDGNPADKQRLSTETVNEDEVEWAGPTSQAQPRAQISDEELDLGMPLEDPADTATSDVDSSGRKPPRADWRKEDHQLFGDILGVNHLHTDGTVWKPEGRHHLDVWYDALRKRADNPMRWPGRYLERLDDGSGHGTGLSEWLAGQGLELD